MYQANSIRYSLLGRWSDRLIVVVVRFRCSIEVVRCWLKERKNKLPGGNPIFIDWFFE